MEKNPSANAEDVGSILGLGRSPGEDNSNLLQYSCLGNPMDRGVWWATVHGVAKESDMTWHLNYSHMLAVCQIHSLSHLTLIASPNQLSVITGKKLRLKEVMVIAQGHTEPKPQLGKNL